MPEYPSNKVTAISGAGYGSSNGSLTFGGNVHVEGNLSTLSNISPGNHLLPKWTAPSIAANPLVSGTVYQNTTGGPIILVVPVTGTAATTAQAAIGPTSTPVAYGGAATVALNALVNVQMIVPQDYYYSLTASGATIGTASVLGL